MKKTLLFSICLCILLTGANSQNLVTNGDFETMTGCPTIAGQITNATGWTSPSTGTPDYFNSCATGVVDIPNNFAGAQAANGGNGYAGIEMFNTTNPLQDEYREYLQYPLSSAMVAGSKYCVSMYVNLAGTSGFSIANFGFYFSNTAPSITSDSAMNVTPQLEYDRNIGHIQDTSDWTLISGVYTAVGGESFVTIGNFYNNTSTPVIAVSGVAQYAYYYIEDVKVEGLIDPLITASKTFACPGDSITLTGTGATSYYWATNGDSTSSIKIPVNSTSTFTMTGFQGTDKRCKNTDTETISIFPNGLVTTGTDTLCKEDTVRLAAGGGSGYYWAISTAPNDTLMTGGNLVHAPEGSATYTYILHGVSNTCNYSKNATVYDMRPLATLPDSVTINQGDSTILNPGVSGTNLTFKWTPGNATTDTLVVKTAGTYTVTVTDTTGCRKMASTVVSVAAGVNENLAAAIALRSYPNPFNGVTNLSYKLRSSERVSIVIYDMIGNEVNTLANNVLQKAGDYNFQISQSDLGNATGFYMVKVNVAGSETTVKLVSIK